MSINADWHRQHPLPNRKTDAERLAWHLAHQQHCGCRPIPARLAALASDDKGRARGGAGAGEKRAKPGERAFARGPAGQRERPGAIEIRPLRPTDWPFIEALFGKNGASAGCWCMFWRSPTKHDYVAMHGEPAKEAFRARVTSGAARGLLAFEAGEPVGWCSLGPRTDFPLTETKRAYVVTDAEKVWSVNCFFIRKDRRRLGLARRLLDAAREEARKAGASVLEGYPSALEPGRAGEGASLYRGALSMFESAGFSVVQKLYPKSPLVRIRLGRDRS